MRRWIPEVVLAALLGGCSHPIQAPAPAPQPEAPAEAVPAVSTKAEPPRAPVEHPMQLCALAPADPAGLRTLEAVSIEGRADTLAVVDGRRIPLADALGDIPVLDGSRWFTAHRSLDLQVGAAIQRYRSYDVARMIDPPALAYLGTADGTPVFAAAEDVAPIKAELARLQTAERELPMRLTASPLLRARLRAIDVLYVPVHASGCVFQAMLRAGAQ